MSLSSTRNTQATITYQESESRSTRAFPRLTSYSGYHVATAKHGSLPMELHSLMNYQNVTQNLFCATHFFAASPGRVFPTDLRPRDSARGPRRNTILIPPLRSSPPPSAPHMPIVRAEDQLPVDKTMRPAWTESEIRSVVGLFELLDRWNSSRSDQTSNLTSWIFRFSVNLKCEWTCR
jgi:hypothetical protein